MFEITILTFNYGNAGRYVNGPGISLLAFVKKLKKINIKVNIYSQLPSIEKEAKPLDDLTLPKSLFRSQIVHHWSGLGPKFSRILEQAKKLNKKILIGPNVLDTVNFSEEMKFLKSLSFEKILTVNNYLKYKIAREHHIPEEKIDLLQSGPDEELWQPSSQDNGKILWKGNSKQPVKDINFGLNLSKRIKKYDFEFLGHPQPYDYFSHVNQAKNCHLYISTSLSETMGLTLLESWISGLPSITHPKIYLHGENYQTGIITNRDLESYEQAIEEVMEDSNLYRQLSLGAQNYAQKFADVGREYLVNYLEKDDGTRN